MTAPIEGVEHAELKASARQSDSTLALELTGTADLRSQEALDAFLRRADESARSSEVSEVTVDLRNLEFMNSSCFKAFVSWIGRLQELDAAHQYRIRFLSDQSLLWQRRSLHALSCFAANLITID